MNCNHCLFCVAGLLAAFAYDNISYKKVATQSHTYAAPNSEASKAVDGSILTCTRTLEIGRISSDKTVWWKVDLGRVYSIYSINIQFKNYDGYVERQRGRFAGFSLYISNADLSIAADIKASTLCYKDGLQLPPLNFTTECTKSGRYVIFYNERSDGVVYPTTFEVLVVFTELCEVIVQGCNNVSFYGSNCDIPCPTNCKDNTCHIQNGTCFNCKPGWTGIYCNTKCKHGWYGVDCTEQCVKHCIESTTCNHVSGQCDRGCAAGWTGDLCNKECADGTYGYNCINNCSRHCLTDSPCNKQTGYCDSGCKPGFTNSDCNKECPFGYFGMDCRECCSGHCTNNEPCDHVSGVCPMGCQDGYIGARCHNSCNKGYYGTNCSRVCSPNCKPDTCRHTDGWCSCTSGWMGYNCSSECMLFYGENCQYRCNLNCINQTCDKINGSCLHGCKNGYQCDQDTLKSITLPSSSSNNLPILVGGIVGTCVIIIIGVVMAIFVIWLKSSTTVCNTSVHRLCLRSTPAAEESINSQDLSNYQELNFSLQENPYQCITR